MPKLIHTQPKYRKHRASGQAIVTLNGRDHYLGPHGTAASKREFDRVIAEWLASGRSPVFGAPEQRLTIVELIAAYLTWAKGYYGEASRGAYANMVRACRPLKALYGRTAAESFGPLEFKAVRQSLMGGRLSRESVNEFMRRIAAVFRWGAGERLFPASVYNDLAIVPGLRKGRCGLRETPPVRPVAAAKVDATLPHLPPVVAAMVRLQQLTGARPGEICALRAGDVDRSTDVWEASLSEHKTSHHGRERIIYFGPQAQEVLKPYLLRPADAYCFSPQESVESLRRARGAARKTPLSCGNRPGTNRRRRRPKHTAGERYSTQSYGRAIARACEKAWPHPVLSKIKTDKLSPSQAAELRAWRAAHRWAPNQLRHAVATRVRREFDLDAARTLLGHAQVGVTEVYAEKDATRAREVARRIG